MLRLVALLDNYFSVHSCLLDRFPRIPAHEKKDNLFLSSHELLLGPHSLWMIEGAAILSGVVRHWLDFFIILFLLFSNAVVCDCRKFGDSSSIFLRPRQKLCSFALSSYSQRQRDQLS